MNLYQIQGSSQLLMGSPLLPCWVPGRMDTDGLSSRTAHWGSPRDHNWESQSVMVQRGGTSSKSIWEARPSTAYHVEARNLRYKRDKGSSGHRWKGERHGEISEETECGLDNLKGRTQRQVTPPTNHPMAGGRSKLGSV